MQKATGITRPVKGAEKGAENWVELWVGDVIKCRVYITDRAGCYLWIEQAEVFWEKDYGQYSIRAKYNSDNNEKVEGIFALREVLRRDIEFITKVPRVLGTQKDVVLAIVEELRVRAKNSVTITDRFVAEPDNNGQITCTDDDIQTIVDTAVYDAMDTVVDRIGSMGIVPKEVINELFVKE
jgi:hypothetical protein